MQPLELRSHKGNRVTGSPERTPSRKARGEETPGTACLRKSARRETRGSRPDRRRPGNGCDERQGRHTQDVRPQGWSAPDGPVRDPSNSYLEGSRPVIARFRRRAGEARRQGRPGRASGSHADLLSPGKRLPEGPLFRANGRYFRGECGRWEDGPDLREPRTPSPAGRIPRRGSPAAPSPVPDASRAGRTSERSPAARPGTP